MKTDFQIIIQRLTAQGIPFRYSVGQASGSDALHHTLEVLSIPEIARNDTIYIIPCSLLKSEPTDLNCTLLCIEDVKAPDWLMRSKTLSVILTSSLNATALVTAIVSELQSAHLRFAGALDEILEALYYGRGLRAICDIGSELLDNPLCMLDTSLKSLAIPSRFPTKTPILRQAWDRGYSDNRDIRFLRSQGWFDPQYSSRTIAYFPHESFQQYSAWEGVSGCCVGYVRANGVIVGYILIAAENKPIMDYEKNWIEKLTQLTALELQKTLPQKSVGAMYESLITDILDGQIGDLHILQRRSELLGKALKQYHRLIVLRKRDQFKNIPFSSVEQKRLRTLFPGSLSTVYQEDLVLLVESDHYEVSFSADLTQLNHELSVSGIAAGVSNVFKDLSEMKNFYQQSLTALNYGCQIVGTGSIFCYSSYTTFHAVELCSQRTDLWELCHPAVSHLYISSASRDKDLFETMYLYLRHMKDVNRVCKDLSIHRSTLFYRLNRIRDQYGVDFDDGETILNLLFSFKIIAYIESLRGAFANEKAGILQTLISKKL